MMLDQCPQYWHGSLVTDGKQIGVLVIGNPGVGKSEFCYYLIENLNYYLVADDLVKLIQIDAKYEGGLCNEHYYGVIHHKQKGFIKTPRALKNSVVSHVLYLYHQRSEEKYINKAKDLMLPMIMIDVEAKNWNVCAMQLQNMLE